MSMQQPPKQSAFEHKRIFALAPWFDASLRFLPLRSKSQNAMPARQMLSPSHLGVLLVALAAILWSTAGYFTRAVPVEFAALLFWRGLFGALTSFVIILAME